MNRISGGGYPPSSSSRPPHNLPSRSTSTRRPHSEPPPRLNNPLAGNHFLGYHGSNQESISGISRHGFDPRRGGQGSGEARGSGAYLTPHRPTARDYADSATQSGDPMPPRYETPRYHGDRGREAIGGVYSERPPSSFRHGRDIGWGVVSSDGDPYGDRRPRASDTSRSGLRENHTQLEAVISPRRYPEMTLRQEPLDSHQSRRRPQYPPYER